MWKASIEDAVQSLSLNSEMQQEELHTSKIEVEVPEGAAHGVYIGCYGARSDWSVLVT